MTFSVFILGASSAVPTASRLPTSQLINLKEQYYLLDCGEGCQVQLRKNHLKFQRIKVIFISHHHGDHIFGLPGLLTTMELLGRKQPLKIVAHKGLKEWLHASLKVSGSYLSFPVDYMEIEKTHEGLVYEDDVVQVSAYPVKHRVPCFAYLIEEKPEPPKIRKEIAQRDKLSIEAYQAIKAGKKELRIDNKLIDLTQYAYPVPDTRKYGFITDTLPLEHLKPHFQNCDLLYHEATFLHELKDRALKTYHTTALEAAELAKTWNAKKLLIGHFSARYKNLSPLLQEAQAIFSNTELAVENERVYIEKG